MAIYSCNVATVGRSTHAAGTAGAHLRYIGRADAASRIEAAHMPDDPQAARAWMDAQESAARKNARLMTKVRLALPRELSAEQNAELVRAFVADIGGGRVPSFHAIHDKGKDAHNPHAHLVLIDRDTETGKRVLRLSDSPREREKAGLVPNGVEWIRQRWEQQANQALERAGHAARIDRRSLAAQGIDREPTIHIGPRGQHVAQAVRRPESKPVPAPTARRPDRVIDYPAIDAGRTRAERNGEIIDFNLEKAARSPDGATRLWAQFEKEQRAQDRPLEARLAEAARRRTREARQARAESRAALAEVRAQRDADGRLARAWVRQEFAPAAAALRKRQAEERDRLRRRRAGVLSRLAGAFDITGHTRKRQIEETRALARAQREERRALTERVGEARMERLRAVQLRYAAARDELAGRKARRLAVLRRLHQAERKREDALLQAREASREQARQVVERQLAAWKAGNRPANDRAPSPASSSPADRQAAVASRLGRDWQRKDEAAAQERTEEVRRRLERRRRREGPTRGR